MRKPRVEIAALLCVTVIIGIGCSSAAPPVETETAPVITEPTTPPPPPPTRDLDPPPPPVEIVMATVYFEFDQHKLEAEARDLLNANSRVLKDQSMVTVLIEGHCDERGTEEYNLALGEKRANSVRDYLVDLGVSASRIRTISYGEERPAMAGSDESAWSLNRRATFVRTDQ